MSVHAFLEKFFQDDGSIHIHLVDSPTRLQREEPYLFETVRLPKSQEIVEDLERMYPTDEDMDVDLNVA